MITSGPYDEEVAPRKKEKLPAEDTLKSANAAIERLALIVTHVAKLPPPQIHIPPAPALQMHPKRLEADIVRDDKGKMARIILVPIY